MSANTTEKQVELLSGPVERVTFHSAESGFCVLKVKVHGHDELVTVVGHNASATAGEYIEAKGSWFNDREHGLQFKAQFLRSIPPTTLEGMEKYLGSGLIKGIGPHFASKLVAAFKEQVFEVIEHEPERLLTLEGIGKVPIPRLSKVGRNKKWSARSWCSCNRAGLARCEPSESTKLTGNKPSSLYKKTRIV